MGAATCDGVGGYVYGMRCAGLRWMRGKRCMGGEVRGVKRGMKTEEVAESAGCGYMR